MPINGDTWLDSRDNPDYGLPKDSCVGNAGPSPTEVTTISKGGSPDSGLPKRLGFVGGPTPNYKEFGG